MKKKIGSSKAMKKYAMAGTVESDNNQKPKRKPTYKNLKMGVKNERYLMSGISSDDVNPNRKDSNNYERGYYRGIAGGKEYPNEGQVEKMGRWEGQNEGKKKLPKNAKGGSVGKKPKMKMGGSCGTPKTLKKKK